MNKRLILVLVTIAVIVSGLVAGCAPPKEEEVIEFKMAMGQPLADNPWIWGAQHFAEEMESRTNGRVKITLSPPGELVSVKEIGPALKKGTIKAMGTPIMHFGGDTYVVYWNYVPGTAKNYELSATERELGIHDFLVEKLRGVGVEYLGSYEALSVDVLIANEHFTVPEDLKGLVVRSADAPVVRALADLGAEPVSIPSDELYMALQTGMVDVGLTASVAYMGSKQYEVAPYCTYVPLIPIGSAIAFNKDFWDSLPADIQKTMREVMLETEDWAVPRLQEYDENILNSLKDLGVKVNVPPRQPWIDALEPLIRKYFIELGGEDAAKIREIIESRQ
ncbi:TRAP transporter substrate-binding protein [Chloroflexota bacterium]